MSDETTAVDDVENTALQAELNEQPDGPPENGGVIPEPEPEPKYGYLDVDGQKFGIWRGITTYHMVGVMAAIRRKRNPTHMMAIMLDTLEFCLDKDYEEFIDALNELDDADDDEDAGFERLTDYYGEVQEATTGRPKG